MRYVVSAALIVIAFALAGCGVTPSAESVAALETLIAQASTAVPAGTALAAASPSAPPPTETPAAPVETVVEDCTYAYTFLGDGNIPDGSVVAPGTPLLKVWRVKNSGDCPWDARVVLRQAGGARLTVDRTLPLPAAAPGEEALVVVPMRAPEAPGTYRALWLPSRAGGRSFGPALYVDFVVQEPPTPTPAAAPAPQAVAAVATPAPCEPDLYLSADVTIKDDTVIAPDTPFAKVWQVRNNGGCDWPADAVLRRVSGSTLGAVDAVPLGPVARGEAINVAVVMRTPEEPGTYTSYWALCDQTGKCYGPWVYVRVVVK